MRKSIYCECNPLKCHNHESTQDFRFLALLAREAGAAEPLLSRIRHATTAQHVLDLVGAAGLPGFLEWLCRQAWHVVTA